MSLTVLIKLIGFGLYIGAFWLLWDILNLIPAEYGRPRLSKIRIDLPFSIVRNMRADHAFDLAFAMGLIGFFLGVIY